jgi:hypothetical protein
MEGRAGFNCDKNPSAKSAIRAELGPETPFRRLPKAATGN